MCLRCAKVAHSSRIAIQLQQKGTAELPLIGRAAREELCVSECRARLHKIIVAEGKQQYERKYYEPHKQIRKDCTKSSIIIIMITLLLLLFYLRF